MPRLRQRSVASITRLYPFYSGCGAFANSALIQRLAGACDATVWTKVKGGTVLAPLGDFVGRAAFYAGELDRKLTWVCSRLLGEGDVALDIGANIGMVTILMSRLVGGSGRVHAFEPNPSLLPLLRQVIERNQLANVRLHPIALGSREDTLELKIPATNSGAASFVRGSGAPEELIARVPVHRLADIANQERIDRVRLIKIDVEGFEAEVFRGAREMLEGVRPDAIIFELNEAIDVPFSEFPVFQLLSSLDYSFLAIPRALLSIRLRQFEPHTALRLIGHDFVAVARGKRHEDTLRRLRATS